MFKIHNIYSLKLIKSTIADLVGWSRKFTPTISLGQLRSPLTLKQRSDRPL
ncbi:MAG: hypothetical protein ACRC6M_04340 [Microcystaceae cyanobacterium]